MDRNIIEDYFRIRLETESLEDILESFDLDPLETLLDLFDRGLINEESI